MTEESRPEVESFHLEKETFRPEIESFKLEKGTSHREKGKCH